MQEMKVSVIVPVYNVAKYVRQCLESLVTQTLKEMEIIIVNDASPDPLDDEICKEYAAKYDHIIYLKLKENLRQGGARNVGIRKAKGAYLGFVDSDDFVEKEMFERMYEKAIAGNYDIVQCNDVTFDKNKSYFKEGTNIQNKEGILDSSDEKMISFFRRKKKQFGYGPCNKISKKSLWRKHNIQFPEKVFHEDYFPMVQILFYSQKILFIKEIFYHYRLNLNSTSRSFKKTRIKDTLFFLKQILAFLKEKKIYGKYKKNYLRFYARHLKGLLIIGFKNNVNKAFLQALKNEKIYHTNFRIRFEIFLLFLIFKMRLYYFCRWIYRIIL